MLFQHSAVNEINPQECVETHPCLPLDIHPAYLGSGPVAFALDGTGMQGLDARQMEAPESISMTHTSIHATDDLHIYHAATLSQHHRSEGIRCDVDMSSVSSSSGQMPAGYFDYALTLDGERFDPEDLAQAATDWRRRTRPGQGTVHTAFRLRGVELEWDATIGRRSNLALFNFSVRSLDKASHDLTIEMRVHLATRWGVDLATGGIATGTGTQFGWCHWQATDATSTAPLKEAYEFAWGVAMDRPVRTMWTAPTLAVAADLTVSADSSAAVHCALHLGCSQTQSGTPAECETSLRTFLEDPAGAWQRAQSGWDAYFASAATFSIGMPQMEYLYHHSQYLLAAGGDWDWGLPANFLWNHNWAGAVFWDMFFAADGMLRAGHADEVRRFLPWLARIAALPDERPFYFMHDYDGARTREDDQAYQVLAAHAGSALRYYEVTGDQAALRDWVYPVLKRVATYTRRRLVTLPISLILGVPVRLRGVPLAVVCNDTPVSGKASADGRTMIVELPAGSSRVILTEDRGAAAEVVVFEEKARGAVFQQLLAEAGVSSRLVRDPRALPAALSGARVLVLPSSIVAVPVYLGQAVETFVQQGGCLIALHHAGCAAINPRLAVLLGVNGETEDRFKADFGTVHCTLGVPHPLTAGLPSSFDMHEADRIKTPRLSLDVTVLAVNADTGDPVATIRAVGTSGGCGIWLAPGQDQAGRQLRYQHHGIEELRLLNLRVDEVFSYPYLQDAPLRQMLVNAVRYGQTSGNEGQKG